ncbi:MAG TPA: hypothetical protein ACFE0H_01300 [Elainellaceae cyanobacterium]|jgi:hypothetical protein
MLDFKISSDILISVATAPLLLGILGGKVLTELLCDFGQASEEIFRGDRLPILNVSHQTSDSSSDR